MSRLEQLDLEIRTKEEQLAELAKQRDQQLELIKILDDERAKTESDVAVLRDFASKIRRILLEEKIILRRLESVIKEAEEANPELDTRWEVVK